MRDKEGYLYSVYEEEEPVTKVFTEIDQAFEANTIGPDKYLVLYEKYLYILNGQAERELHEFFGTQPFPYLKVNQLLV